jgi:hypothetical protein
MNLCSVFSMIDFTEFGFPVFSNKKQPPEGKLPFLSAPSIGSTKKTTN